MKSIFDSIKNKFNDFNESINEKKQVEVDKKKKIIEAQINWEKEIKNQFYDLDVLSLNTIATMLAEVKESYNTSNNSDLLEIELSKIIFDFCKDSYEVDDIFELDNIYDTLYYRRKISKNLFSIETYVKNKIVRIAHSSQKAKAIEIYDALLNHICDALPKVHSIKIYSIFSAFKDKYSQAKKEKYGLGDFDDRYKDALIYMTDILATCTCISKILFIENKINSMNSDTSELYKIITNMAKEVNDINIIIERTRPIYNEFYKSELGFIDDGFLYDMAVSIILNKDKFKGLDEEDSKILNINTKEDLNESMNYWLRDLAKDSKYKSKSIEKYILFKIILTTYGNFETFIECLPNKKCWLNYYSEQVDYNNKLKERERYLSGDFEREKSEVGEQYNLNNITTGVQFEIYLEKIFKDLGYKVKHTGKTGDQGADLILKREDYVYVVQAKFYTSALGNTPIQEIVGSLKYYNANQGVVITNNSFTKGAETLARANNVILIDGEKLKNLIDYIFESDIKEDVLQKIANQK